MIKFFMIIILMYIFSGCSNIQAPITQYKLKSESIDYKSTANTCKDKSVKVLQAFSSNSLMNEKMMYIQDKQKIYSYTQAQWNNSLNQEISAQILKALRDSKLFKNTQISKSRSNSDLILETNIEEFVQHFNADLTKSYVNVVISFSLIDSKTNNVIDAKTFSAKNDVTTLDASGGVKALDAALNDVLKQAIVFLDKVCL